MHRGTSQCRCFGCPRRWRPRKTDHRRTAMTANPLQRDVRRREHTTRAELRINRREAISLRTLCATLGGNRSKYLKGATLSRTGFSVFSAVFAAATAFAATLPHAIMHARSASKRSVKNRQSESRSCCGAHASMQTARSCADWLLLCQCSWNGGHAECCMRHVVCCMRYVAWACCTPVQLNGRHVVKADSRAVVRPPDLAHNSTNSVRWRAHELLPRALQLANTAMNNRNHGTDNSAQRRGEN